MGSEAESFKSVRSTFHAMEMNYQNHQILLLKQALPIGMAGKSFLEEIIK